MTTHPVDSTTRPCCQGIGNHAQDCTTTSQLPTNLDFKSDQDGEACTSWCDADHNADPACWSWDDERVTPLSLEEGYDHAVAPDQALRFGLPRISVYPYRERPGYREVLYLNIYRPSDNDFLNLDTSVNLTAPEARQLAAHLIAAADIVTTSAREES